MGHWGPDMMNEEISTGEGYVRQEYPIRVKFVDSEVVLKHKLYAYNAYEFPDVKIGDFVQVPPRNGIAKVVAFGRGGWSGYLSKIHGVFRLSKRSTMTMRDEHMEAHDWLVKVLERELEPLRSRILELEGKALQNEAVLVELLEVLKGAFDG